MLKWQITPPFTPIIHSSKALPREALSLRLHTSAWLVIKRSLCSEGSIISLHSHSPHQPALADVEIERVARVPVSYTTNENGATECLNGRYRLPRSEMIDSPRGSGLSPAKRCKGPGNGVQ
jgi:hypothetical protein